MIKFTKRIPFFIHVPQPKGIIHVEKDLGNGYLQLTGKVCSALFTDGVLQDVTETRNIITDSGDLFYAYMGEYIRAPSTTVVPTGLFTDGATPSVFDGIMELYTGVTADPASVGKAAIRSTVTASGTLVTGSAKAMDSGYPKRNDTDSANTGKGTDIITYKVSYADNEANATSIDDIIITNPSPGASEALLMWADGLARNKTSSDTLIEYVNHQMNGV